MFLKKLFSNKIGGTFIGNLFRKAVNHYTFGLFGNGDARDTRDAGRNGWDY